MKQMVGAHLIAAWTSKCKHVGLPLRKAAHDPDALSHLDLVEASEIENVGIGYIAFLNRRSSSCLGLDGSTSCERFKISPAASGGTSVKNLLGTVERTAYAYGGSARL